MTKSNPPLSNVVKAVWATSIAHLVYLNPDVELNAPATWAPFLPTLAFVVLILMYGIGALVIWAIARGITKDQLWARRTFITLMILSLPERVFSLFHSNSMFNGVKFRLSFFIVLAWCVLDAVLVHSLWSPARAITER